MRHILTSTDIKDKEISVLVWNKLKQITENEEGAVYYKYPISGTTEAFLPDFSIVDYQKGISIIDIFHHNLESISNISDDIWTISGEKIESPIFNLEDYVVGLQNRFRKYRGIRNKVSINYFVLFPMIDRDDFNRKFPDNDSEHFLFKKIDAIRYSDLWLEQGQFTEEEKNIFISVSQGAGQLNNFKRLIDDIKADKIGEAIKLLDTKIAILDKRQEEAAIQIPDGPQRIRGMAGTGKTIILTMKAAHLHSRFPDKKILYTFHTQSLYNQIKNFITRFYRETQDKDPNWENLLVLHSWGGRTTKEGVYYRTCLRNSIVPLSLNSIQYTDEPFEVVCADALKNKLNEEFDFVLMDESQDFPGSFFKLIYKITRDPKRIIFAYDELQTLTSFKIQDTGELFGYKPDGTKNVDFARGEYYGGIEMDYVLEKSYRNPAEILMVAHGLGMGIYNKNGIMQLIDDEKVWEAIGYKVTKGQLSKGNQVVIERPKENSTSLVHEVYSGTQKALTFERFDSGDEEISAISSSIENDVFTEKVEPHHIVVVSLKMDSHKKEFVRLQKSLYEKNVPSIIPGAGGVERDKFAELGFVTLASVFKAKGNEAFIIYVMNFDCLYDYVDFIQIRNKAFTSITRTKGWCRISGVGQEMDRAIEEIKKIQADFPKFKFVFPDPKHIARKLSQEEHARRLAESKKMKKAFDDILTGDVEAIKKISKKDRAKLLDILKNDADN